MNEHPDIATSQPLSLSELMQRGVLFSEKCPSREVLKHVTSRWGVLILLAALFAVALWLVLRPGRP